MNTKTLLLLTFSVVSVLSSCSDDESENLDVFYDEHSADLVNYALSAGTSTIFNNTSKAYDIDAEWLSGTYATRWQNGNRLYDNVTDKYGPVYAGYSCGSCHMNAGRTNHGVWNYLYTDTDGSPVYGSGTNGMSAMLVYVARKNGVFFQDYGRVLHDQTIYGVTAEGKLEVRYNYERGTFPDGEEYELAHPNYTVVKWYKQMWDEVQGKYVDIKPEDLFCTVRIPLRHVGMGQMMALDREEIKALAAKSNYPEYGISGRCNYITERGVYDIGLSGNKAQHQDLTVELGFSSDMGATNSRYPEEICEGQLQMIEGSMMGLTYDRLDVSAEDMENVDLYLHSLGVPARRLGDVGKQTLRMWENVEKLLEEGGATYDDVAQIVVYLRDVADYGLVEKMFREKFPDTPYVITLAPVCRPTWLIEMECIAITQENNTAYRKF